MSSSGQAFVGSIPEIYDTHMVPLIFDCYAQDLARRATTDGAASRVLEVAAGTGALTRALAPLLPSDAQYVVTDLNPPMLERARQRQPPDQRIEWRQADALALPFEDAAFDLVCCQFGVMFFPDRVAGYREVRRVLTPGGRFAFNVWDDLATNDFASLVAGVLAAAFPDDPPHFMATTPHGYHDVDRIRDELQAGGFTRVEGETVEMESRAETARDVAVAYCQGTPMRVEIESRNAAALEPLTRRATDAIAERYGPGPLSGRITAHVFVAYG